MDISQDADCKKETVSTCDQRHDAKTLLSLLTSTQAYLEFLSADALPDEDLDKGWAKAYPEFDAVIRQLVGQCRIPEADREDCVQQVWLDVIIRLAGFNWNPERSGIVNWFGKLVRSEATNTKRKNGRNATEDVDRVADTLARCTAEPPDTHREEELLRMALAKLRGSVSNENYQIFVMRVLERRRVTEIALEVQLTPKQVSDRVYSVKQRLRDLIKAVSE